MVNIRETLRSMWTDSCTVYEYAEVSHPNGATTHEDVAVIVDEPCKLSFSRLTNVKQTDTAAEAGQVVKLFLDEKLKIKSGSKIVVTRNENKFIYACSGEPGIFDDHQEIVLIPWKEQA